MKLVAIQLILTIIVKNNNKDILIDKTPKLSLKFLQSTSIQFKCFSLKRLRRFSL